MASGADPDQNAQSILGLHCFLRLIYPQTYTNNLISIPQYEYALLCIFRLISERTVEENILKKANQKRMLGDKAIEGGNFTTIFFKEQTIGELFTEPSDLNSLLKEKEEKEKGKAEKQEKLEREKRDRKVEKEVKEEDKDEKKNGNKAMVQFEMVRYFVSCN